MDSKYLKNGHINYPCLYCHGNGWYSKERKWGCFYCGGSQYPSRQGSGIMPETAGFYFAIEDEVFSELITKDDAVAKTMELYHLNRANACNALNKMYKNGTIFRENDKFISAVVWRSLHEHDDDNPSDC